MSLTETDIFGVTHDKVQMSIDRIKMFEPKDKPYWGGHSFGKDSVVIQDLAEMAGVAVEWHHSLTTVDAPEVIKFGRQVFPEVLIDKPEIPLLKLLPNKGFPTRQNRWCCDYYKHRGGEGRTVLLGIRREESFMRSGRMVQQCLPKNKVTINPILDWTEADVWDHINARKLPFSSLYSSGWTRIGCLLCPLASHQTRLDEARRWPGMARAWERSFIGLYENRKHRPAYSRWKSGEAMFDWWLYQNMPGLDDPDQTVMFE